MPKPIRRVVTGHDAAGRSVFIMDGAAPHVYQRSPGSAVVTELWETRMMPAENGGSAEATDHAFRLAPPKNGTVFRVIEYPPDRQRLAALERERASADDGSGHSAAFDRGSPRHPGFHKTNSVDYAIVLSGEIYALRSEEHTSELQSHLNLVCRLLLEKKKKKKIKSTIKKKTKNKKNKKI